MISIYQSQNPVELKCKYQRPQEFNAESFRRGYLIVLGSNARIVTMFVEADPRQFRSDTLWTAISGS